MGKCVLEGCGRDCLPGSELDICEVCRGNICSKTRDQTPEQVSSHLTEQNKKYTLYMARNAIATDTGAGSYMEQLTTRRKLRKQQEQQRHAARIRRRTRGASRQRA